MLNTLFADIRRGLFYRRHADTVLRIVTILTPFFLVAAAATVNSNKNRVEDWLPASFQETTELKWFRQHFPSDQFLILSWEGCQLGGDPTDPSADRDDERIEKLAKLLTSGTTVPGPSGQTYQHYFKSVTTARNALTQLTAPPSEVPYEEAVNRLKGSLIGPDGRQTCLVVTLAEDGQADLRGTIGRGDRGVFRVRREPGVLYQALATVGLDASTIHLVGPAVDNVSIDEEGEKTLVRLAGLAGLLGLGLAYWSLRSVRLTLIVFTCGVLSAMLGLALVSILGSEADAVLMSMPALVYVLAISGAVHLVNYYRDAMTEPDKRNAPMKAILHGWKPALLCSVTTAIGLGSLYASDLAPIRKFGVFSALGVMATLAVLFLFLPAALQRFPVVPTRRKLEDGTEHESEIAFEHTWIDRMWQGFGAWIIRHHALVSIGCCVFIALTGCGLAYVRTSIDLLKLFDHRAKILADYAWMESHLGRLVPMELVLQFPEETLQHDPHSDPASVTDAKTPASTGRALQFSFLERMEAVQAVQREIEARFGAQGDDVLGRAMSAATFAPVLPEASGSTMQYTLRTATNRQLQESREAFEKTGYLHQDQETGAELWRISLGVAAFENLDYGQFTSELHASVEPLLDVITVRSAVLRALQQKHGDGEYAGAKVLIWNGASPETMKPAGATTLLSRLVAWKDASPTDAASAKSKPLAAMEPAVETREKAAEAHEDAARQRILQELLAARRLQVKSVRRQAKDDSSAALTEQQLKGLQDLDCVVVLGGLTDKQLEQWRKSGINLVDGRFSGGSAHGANSTTKPIAVTSPAPSAQALRDPAAGTSPKISAIYTGVVPIVYKAQRALLASLIESTFWSFVTITPLMMWVARSVSAGTVVMLPNALPVLVIFGGMGWLGVPVDIGSMMSASIALGVAVDDTIHFLTWFRQDLNRLKDRRLAILSTYRRCATPTLQAALISGLGLSVFAFSTFTPTQKFGWLMLTILVAGVVSELVMFPALLAGPLGRFFKPEDHPTDTDWTSHHDAETPSLERIVPPPHALASPKRGLVEWFLGASQN